MRARQKNKVISDQAPSIQQQPLIEPGLYLKSFARLDEAGSITLLSASYRTETMHAIFKLEWNQIQSKRLQWEEETAWSLEVTLKSKRETKGKGKKFREMESILKVNFMPVDVDKGGADLWLLGPVKRGLVKWRQSCKRVMTEWEKQRQRDMKDGRRSSSHLIMF